MLRLATGHTVDILTNWIEHDDGTGHMARMLGSRTPTVDGQAVTLDELGELLAQQDPAEQARFEELAPDYLIQALRDRELLPG